jgi:hypothetical protein
MERLMKTLFRAATLAALAAFCVAPRASEAAIITITFNGINGAPTYSEAGVSFAVTGNHTDASNEMYFHDGGANPGDNDLLISFGGAAFSILSIDLLYAGDPATFTGNVGAPVSIAAGAASGTTAIGLLNVTSVSVETGGGGLYFDNMVIDTAPRAVAVPAPAALAVFGMGLLGLAGATRLRRAPRH